MKRIGVFCGILIVIYVAGVVLLNIPQKQKNTTSTPTFGQPTPSQMVKPSANLKIEDSKIGTGAEAKQGDTVSVNYVGTLTNGQKFDSSYDRKQPFDFTLGAGDVIKGWDQGVAGMKVGGKRKLTIPPELGYGAQAQGSIPANSTLVFEIELLKVTPSSQQSQKPNLNL